MGVPAYVSGFYPVGYKTAAGGTAITAGIPGKDGDRLALLDGRITAAATAHTLSFLYAKGTGSRNTASAAAASGQAKLNVTDAPKDPAGNAAAANDVIAYQLSDGTWEFNTIVSVNVKEITLTNNISDPGVAAGAKACIIGVIGDGAHFDLAVPAAAQAKFGEGEVCVVHPFFGEPFWVSDNNTTNAGSIDNLVFAYINK